MDNPGKDGWDTEVFNNVAGKQLKKIGKLLTHPQELAAAQLGTIISPDFTTTGLFPEQLQLVFTDGSLEVSRLATGSGNVPQATFSGFDGFIEAAQKQAVPFDHAKDLRFKFKLFRINKSVDHVVSRQYFAISGITDSGALEHNGTWDITWVRNGNKPPLVASISVVDFEQVASKGGPNKIFQEITPSVLQGNESYDQQILHGYPEYLSSIENVLDFNVFGTPGIALGDVNGDGLDDLYLCQERGLPNRLYIQNQDGTASDISADAGVDWLESSRSALLLDFDNDGDQDLAVTMPGVVILAENDGRGRFSKAASLAVADDPMSMAAADYDNDGDLDLYVGLYNPDRPLEKNASQLRGRGDTTFVYHDANNGPSNVMFRNDLDNGTWSFTDVTRDSGLDVNNSRFTLGVAWEDYDNDGDQDLYVANDYGRDNLYRNDTIPSGETIFTDVSDEAAIENSAGSMAVCWGDYNRDGFMEPFISTMWSSAGNRVTFQSHFKSQNPEVKKRLQRFAHGCTMLKNNGGTTFSDVSEPSGTEMGRWAWSSDYMDINNDGWEDLVVANGFLTGDEKGGDL